MDVARERPGMVYSVPVKLYRWLRLLVVRPHRIGPFLLSLIFVYRIVTSLESHVHSALSSHG